MLTYSTDDQRPDDYENITPSFEIMHKMKKKQQSTFHNQYF